MEMSISISQRIGFNFTEEKNDFNFNLTKEKNEFTMGEKNLTVWRSRGE